MYEAIIGKVLSLDRWEHRPRSTRGRGGWSTEKTIDHVKYVFVPDVYAAHQCFPTEDQRAFMCEVTTILKEDPRRNLCVVGVKFVSPAM